MPTLQRRLEALTQKRWFYLVLLALFFLPSYSSLAYDPRRTSDLITAVLSHPLIYAIPSPMPVFKILPALLVLGLVIWGDRITRLFDAYVEFGDYLVSKGQWCKARDQYNGALSYSVNAEVVTKRESTEQQCIQGTLPTATPPPSGVFVGKMLRVEDVGSSSAMMIRGYVKNAQGQPLPDIRVGLSAFDWNAPPALTTSEGLFSFDGLANPVTYTVTLLELASVPLPVKADWSKLVWVELQAQP